MLPLCGGVRHTLPSSALPSIFHQLTTNIAKLYKILTYLKLHVGMHTDKNVFGMTASNCDIKKREFLVLFDKVKNMINENPSLGFEPQISVLQLRFDEIMNCDRYATSGNLVADALLARNKQIGNVNQMHDDDDD